MNGFKDPWLDQKIAENAASLAKFRERLAVIDGLQSKAKWLEIFKGVFAGNVFDWGALVVSQMLENDLSFGLEEALKHIQPRPWLIDDMDAWLERIEVSFYYTRCSILNKFYSIECICCIYRALPTNVR